MTRYNKKHNRTQFGEAVNAVLTANNQTMETLASVTGKSATSLYRVTADYQTSNGKPYKPNAQWAELVANALKLSDAERQRLHEAAAKDCGFKLDLTKK